MLATERKMIAARVTGIPKHARNSQQLMLPISFFSPSVSPQPPQTITHNLLIERRVWGAINKYPNHLEVAKIEEEL